MSCKLCGKKIDAKGLCSKHYTDYKRNKIDINGKPVDINKRPHCFKCPNVNLANYGLCWKHYKQFLVEKKRKEAEQNLQPIVLKPEPVPAKLEVIDEEQTPVKIDYRLARNWKLRNSTDQGIFLRKNTKSSIILARIYQHKDTTPDVKALCKEYLDKLGVKELGCIVKDCGRGPKNGYYIQGFCGLHYNRFLKGIIDKDGNPLRPVTPTTCRNKAYGNFKKNSISNFNNIINNLALVRIGVVDALKKVHDEKDSPEKELIINRLLKIETFFKGLFNPDFILGSLSILHNYTIKTLIGSNTNVEEVRIEFKTDSGEIRFFAGLLFRGVRTSLVITHSEMVDGIEKATKLALYVKDETENRQLPIECNATNIEGNLVYHIKILPKIV